MDRKKLLAGLFGGVGAAVGVIGLLFLPWYGFLGYDQSAFDSTFLSWGGALASVIGGAITAVVGLSSRGDWPRIDRWTGVRISGIGLVLIVLRLVSERLYVKVGIFVGLLGAILAVLGGALLVAGSRVVARDG